MALKQGRFLNLEEDSAPIDTTYLVYVMVYHFGYSIIWMFE